MATLRPVRDRGTLPTPESDPFGRWGGRASRLHDRPVSNVWFTEDLLGIPVASLRQTAIQRLISAVGCDGPEVAAHTALSLGAVGAYMRVFDRPRRAAARWPTPGGRPARSGAREASCRARAGARLPAAGADRGLALVALGLRHRHHSSGVGNQHPQSPTRPQVTAASSRSCSASKWS
jgi:hypothetical protein